MPWSDVLARVRGEAGLGRPVVRAVPAPTVAAPTIIAPAAAAPPTVAAPTVLAPAAP